MDRRSAGAVGGRCHGNCARAGGFSVDANARTCRLGRDPLQLITEVAAPVANFRPRDKEMRRERGLVAVGVNEPALTLRELGLSKRLLPTDVIPVVHVKRDRDDLLQSCSRATGT